MNQEKFGQLIKKIRKDNNLTQKEMAENLGVTYQAVSKWENGKNMPDTSILKDISKKYKISIEELLDGEYKEKDKQKNKLKKEYFIIPLLMILIIMFLLLYINRNNDFKFKTISSKCNSFNISGTLSYNNKKTAIYINNIEYCGEYKDENYKEIKCTLYEKYNETEKVISTKIEKNTTLKDFLKDLNFTVDNYSKTCKDYSNNSLYLNIDAKDNENKITNYKIPLKLNDNCKLD